MIYLISSQVTHNQMKHFQHASLKKRGKQPVYIFGWLKNEKKPSRQKFSTGLGYQCKLSDSSWLEGRGHKITLSFKVRIIWINGTYPPSTVSAHLFLSEGGQFLTGPYSLSPLHQKWLTFIGLFIHKNYSEKQETNYNRISLVYLTQERKVSISKPKYPCGQVQGFL